jgi:HD-GYP domain-containing protein (c-di-GMP phosphodiesterase class II)
MVRMSDILKKAQEKKSQEDAPAESPVVQQAASEESASQSLPQQAGPAAREDSQIRLSSVIKSDVKPASLEEVGIIYNEAVSLMKELLKENVDYQSIDVNPIIARVVKIVDQALLDNEKLLLFAFNSYPNAEDYFPMHLVNVCIYSAEVGIGLGYDKPKLMDLAVSVILHDVGMVKYMNLANEPRRLNTKEFNEIKQHTIEGANILKKVSGLDKSVADVARQEHERVDGSGYPEGLGREEISEFAKIAGVVDVYEAMIHPRPYREKRSPLYTMKELLANKDAFDYKIIKALMEKLGVFPVGSLVELNTKEVARIMKLSDKAPLRPVVEIIYDSEGRTLKEPKIVDLNAQPTLIVDLNAQPTLCIKDEYKKEAKPKVAADWT